MAPRGKAAANPDAWWQQAYQNHPDIEASFEYDLNGDTMVPGTKFKVKYHRGEFKFRCMATNVRTGKVWIDCIEVGSAFRSFYPESLKGVVKPKRRRRRTIKKT
ncbi:hypothetical protein SEA_ANNADREAMY_83 [Streptomyces phage Annadreamy]|uniref:DUF7246 domain-containing protein n=2 Tax=Annadreamyvirus annadreamy TaxID=2846392 RepID=A0A345GTD0_9CAUD|nr:hypothetical protein HWB75_gp163 [Streptomyces phage Annadreamy]AXG66202.1 hypothetical protein SEA_ANNADREAMY_83 [Streptomyces phage Annadreamy]QGH79415.1 hypothetical protein SEA_LIMPID_82 [Streptomyces phage Limpid]